MVQSSPVALGGRLARGLQLLDAACGVAVPALAAGAMPEMGAGFKAAGGTAVAQQRFAGMVQRFLHGGVELFLLQLFACQPQPAARGLFYFCRIM